MNNQEFFQEVIKMVNEGQTVSFPVKGTSMNPFLKEGLTEVFISKSNSYKERDICLFLYNKKYVLHRLSKIKEGNYYFKGDHSYTFEIVKEEDIIAKVDSYITGNKTINPNHFIQQGKLRMFLFYKRLKMVLRRTIKGK